MYGYLALMTERAFMEGLEAVFDSDTAVSLAIIAWRAGINAVGSQALDVLIRACEQGTWRLLDIPAELWSSLTDILRFSQLLSADHLVLELHQDKRGFGDVADRARADHDVLHDAPPLGHQREAAFALVAQGAQQRVPGFRVDIEFAARGPSLPGRARPRPPLHNRNRPGTAGPSGRARPAAAPARAPRSGGEQRARTSGRMRRRNSLGKPGTRHSPPFPGMRRSWYRS